MIKGLLLFPPLLLAVVSSGAQTEETSLLKDENARIQYSVGYQAGENFTRQGVEINPEIVAKGVEDTLAGGELLMTPAEMRTELTAVQERVMAAHMAREVAREEERAAEQRRAAEAFLEANKHKEGVKVTESGLQYRIIEPGTGKRPGPTDKIKVNYRGTRIDGSEFDSSYKRGKPAEFTMGRVIKGWTEGLQLMRQGGKAELFIPPDLAYGNRGNLGNQTLIFEVELIEVRETAASGTESAEAEQ